MKAARLTSSRQLVLATRARLMRFAPTESEAQLWEALRGGKLGIVFRRQVPVAGRYIADFAASEVRVIVEVDGEWHGRRGPADERRDRALRRAGWRVVRVEARVVMEALPEALACIREALAR